MLESLFLLFKGFQNEQHESLPDSKWLDDKVCNIFPSTVRIENNKPYFLTMTVGIREKYHLVNEAMISYRYFGDVAVSPNDDDRYDEYSIHYDSLLYYLDGYNMCLFLGY